MTDKELDVCVPEQRIKVSYFKVFATKWRPDPDYKPYYQIEYHDLTDGQTHIGFGSYKADYVYQWAAECFEIVSEPEKSAEYIAYPKVNVITLCGSTKFKDDFIRIQKELILRGNIVLSLGLFGHSGDVIVWEGRNKKMLDDMHLQMIDMADEIFIINVGGYIGESTANEIEYAKSKNKIINYLEANNE